MHAGFDPGPALAEADLVLVVDGLTPWIPLRHRAARRLPRDPARPRPAVRRHAGARLPLRPGAAGDVAATLSLLGARAGAAGWPEPEPRAGRELAARHAAARAERLAAADAGGGPPMSPAFVSRRLAERCRATRSCSPSWAATRR